jgi:hypothetical protein
MPNHTYVRRPTPRSGQEEVKSRLITTVTSILSTKTTAVDALVDPTAEIRIED